MSYQVILEKWKKDGTYAEELTFIAHCVRIGYTVDKIARSYGLTLKEFKEMAKADKMVEYATRCVNIIGRREYLIECRKAAFGYIKKEPREENYVDSNGNQRKRIIYLDRWVPGTFKDREFYGKKFIDEIYTDQNEEYGLKTDLKESGKAKCVKKSEQTQVEVQAEAEQD